MRFNWFTYSVVIGFLQRGESGVSGKEVRKPEAAGTIEEGRWPDDHLLVLAQKVKNELRLHIWAAGIRKQSTQELLLSLPPILRSYTELTVLQAYPYRFAINNFIEMETASCCSIHLNEEELLRLWPLVR